ELGRHLRAVNLSELPDEALVVPVGGMGAPTVGLEKLGRGDEGAIAVQSIAEHFGVAIAATVPIEIGGGNSIGPLIAAAQLGLPMVDADGMGRAFPEGSMISYYFDGRATPCAIMVDSRHRQITFENIPGTIELERVSRAMCVQFGGSAQVADAPIPVGRLREVAIRDTLTQARNLGDAVLRAQGASGDPVEEICRESGGRRFFAGKVTDVDRRVERGYNFGRLTLEGTDRCKGQRATIDVQNEFLILRVDGDLLATVPDIITLVDQERGLPITTEVVRYGLRVQVLGIPAAKQLTTEQALRWVGPRAFGYDLDFTPLEVATADDRRRHEKPRQTTLRLPDPAG
ncbi:MAG: DUF917 domain-containing protein, partial [Trebonia sp.]